MTIFSDIKGLNRKKPVCYDPERDRFITIDDLDADREKLIPLERLTDEQLKRLVIERNRVGEDYSVETDWKRTRSRNEIVQEIEADTETGRMAVKAEIMYLKDHLRDIETRLKRSGR